MIHLKSFFAATVFEAIRNAHPVTLIVATLMATGVQSTQAGTIALNATVQGWFRSNGSHIDTNTNYIVGQYVVSGAPLGLINDFFAFDIPPIASIMSASLVVYNPSSGYASGNPSETVVLHDVSTPISTLAAYSPSESPTGRAVYNDLGSGVVFASQTVSAADNNSNVAFSLNDAAIASLIASLGQPWAIGGTISPITLPAAQNETVFTYSTGGPVQLILQTVPEPSTLVLAAFGFFALACWLRNRR